LTLAPNIPKLTSAWDTDRHGKKAWELFVESISIDGLRGWSGETVDFRFPVVAIAGENGAGKSTVLKALASAYRTTTGASSAGAVTYSPDDFFPNTPWEDVSGVTLAYKYRHLSATNSGSLRKATSRWRGAPERPYRGVFFLDISRIQPANTLIGYGRLAQIAIAGDTKPIELSAPELNSLNRVMGKSYRSGTLNKVSGKQVGVLQSGDISYSNFHQGAGEDATFDLIALLNGAPKNSLVLIDEVEASLHPKAQRRLVT
jgi:energy-coupling factor transporter ATP-binding protein EcfA2